jgi:hypothetical protein
MSKGMREVLDLLLILLLAMLAGIGWWSIQLGGYN